jgi:hypothetical protein
MDCLNVLKLEVKFLKIKFQKNRTLNHNFYRFITQNIIIRFVPQ